MIPWGLFDRLAVSATKFPVTSANAFNLWALPFFGLWGPLSTSGWLSTSFQSWGWLLVTAASVPALAAAWRRPWSPATLVWSSFVVALAFFVLPTQIHERYLFATLPIVALAVAVDKKAVGYYAAVSLVYLVNNVAVYLNQPAGPGMLEASPFAPLIPAGSALSLLLLIGGLLHLAQEHLSGSEATRPHQEPSPSPLWLPRETAVPHAGKGAGTPRTASASLFLRRFGFAHQLSLLLVATAALLIARGLVGNDGAVRSLVVHANRSWQGTGVRLSPGERFFVAAQGDWTNRIGRERFGPGGTWRTVGGTIMPSVPIGVLLGRVGDSDPFVVGEQALLSSPGSGELQLVMNDWPNDRHDVQGFVTVHIIPLGAAGYTSAPATSPRGGAQQVAPSANPPQDAGR